MSKVLSFKKPEKEINFKVFGRNAAEGNLDEAAKILRDLLKCDLDEAQRITQHFHKKFQESPNIIMQTMQLRNLVEQGKTNDALASIQELFGVSGPQLIQFFEIIKEQVK